jgi:hypothetical protein
LEGMSLLNFFLRRSGFWDMSFVFFSFFSIGLDQQFKLIMRGDDYFFSIFYCFIFLRILILT